MAVCVSCGKRKGKRSCPALAGLICPRCCGTKRIVEIACPPTCPYLTHERYQGERILSQSVSPFQKRYLEAARQGEASLETLIVLDVHVADFLRENPDFPLAALRDGLGYLRRATSPLETVQRPATAFEAWLHDRLLPLVEEKNLQRERLAQAAEETLAFFDQCVQDIEALRSYLRFVAAFVGDAPRPWAEDGPRGGRGGPGGGLIVPG